MKATWTAPPFPSRGPCTQPVTSACLPPTLPTGGLEAFWFWFWFWFWLRPDSGAAASRTPRIPETGSSVQLELTTPKCTWLCWELVGSSLEEKLMEKRHGLCGGPLCPRAGETTAEISRGGARSQGVPAGEAALPPNSHPAMSPSGACCVPMTSPRAGKSGLVILWLLPFVSLAHGKHLAAAGALPR